MTLSGSSVVIVGGSSGIGRATAEAAARDGAMVTIVGRDPAKLAEAAAAIGPNARPEPADATDRASLDRLFARIGSLDHLVLAASGGRGAGPFGALAPDALRAGFDAKFWSHWHAAQSALSYLAEDGSIVFVTAASSRLANPGTSGLAAINGALERMARTLARELAPRRVNAVSPGVVDTPWWADKPVEMFQQASRSNALQRAGSPDEIADAILFLMCNRFTTGVVLDVDGGLHLT